MTRGQSSTLAVFLGLAVATLSLWAWGQDAGQGDAAANTPTADAGVDAGGADADAGRADIDELQQTTRRVRALIAGNLESHVEPESLFSVALDDARAIDVEVRRLRSILDAAAAPPDAGTDAALTLVPGADAGAEAGIDAAPPPALRDVDPKLWQAQLELDRAHLAFLQLPENERQALLEKHEQRVASDKDVEEKKVVSDAEKAEEDLKKALEDAEKAGSERIKLLKEEEARLLKLKVDLVEFKRKLLAEEEKVKGTAEDTAAWKRKVSGLISRRREGKATAEEADLLYKQLVTKLRAGRQELSTALGEVSSSTQVPESPESPIDIPPGAETEGETYKKIFDEVRALDLDLQKREQAHRWNRTKQLYGQVESMNRDRLTLYPELSTAQRSALTGVSTQAIEQAQAETRQLTVVVRYHVLSAGSWITGKREREGLGAKGVVGAVLLLWVSLLIAGFWFWRRIATRLLEMWQERIDQSDEGHLAGRPRLIDVLRRIRRPSEWLVFLMLLHWLLGADIRAMLEVRLLWIIASWTLGGSVAVLLIDALATQTGGRAAVVSGVDVPSLRLRSLRLLGRVIVTFGLILALSAELVGKGTIHTWVWSTCWFSAIPLALLLVSWWRPVIFERLQPLSKRRALAEWVVSRKDRWYNFLVAAVGGTYLVVNGTGRFLRNYVATFTLTRRVLAYLFRREVSKRADDGDEELTPLADSAVEQFDPAWIPMTLVETAAEDTVAALVDRMQLEGGGVFAIVGERGLGKTTLLGRIAREHEGCEYLQCPLGGHEELRVTILEALGLPPKTTNEQLDEYLSTKTGDHPALLIDDAQRLVRPTVGGYAELDAILELARSLSDHCAWVFSFGASVFRYIERARGVRPLFDDVIVLEPWKEEAIAELLKARTASSELTPSFEGLSAEQPAMDEEERREQLVRVETRYYRLLWDFSDGNPAVALYFWRASLGSTSTDDTAVKLFRAPPTDDLERLPDPPIFVLRAVLLLEPARKEDIVETTRLPPAQVDAALRYAELRSYIERREDGRFRVRWLWFRTLTRVLKRRHLLAQ